jgi:hypothetical protein
LPDEQLRKVANVGDFAGMLVFDKWTCNTNGRQTVFFEAPRKGTALADDAAGTAPSEGTPERGYQTVMIDQGFCFNAGEWNFPDAPLRGLYARNGVYEGVTGMYSFAPWLERLEKRITERVLAELAAEIPPIWYDDDYDALMRLIEALFRRKQRVPELLWQAKQSNRQPFLNWRELAVS